MMQASQIMMTYSLVRHQEKNYSIPTISTLNSYTQRIVITSSSILNLYTPTILSPVGKEFMFFLKEGRTDQAARFIKSIIITKVVDSILSIDTFEQKCVVLKVTLKSLQLKDHVQTIGIDQYKIVQQLMYKLFMLVN